MKLLIKKGTTSKLLQVFVPNSSVSTGAGLTGLVYNSASLTGYYYREGAASATAITLATMTVGTWATGGFKEIDATNMPGVYQIGIPDAAIATGANSVVVMLKGAANMAPVVLEIQLVDFDPNDATRLGLTALPNANAAANGGLPTVDASNAVKVQSGTGANQINLSSGNVTVSAHTAGAKAEINAEVVDCLNVDTYAELGAVPAATSTLVSKINWLFALARNKRTTSTTTETLRNDADSASIATAAISDSGTTFTRAEWA